MKTIFKIMAAAIYMLSPLLSLAQAPMKFNYQGIVRDVTGLAVASKSVGVRLSILDGSPVGAAQYVETHTVNTNQYGLFNVLVGGGTAVTGTMNDVAWSTGDKYLKVEFDPAGGTVYTDLGATQMVSVPFALRARQLDTLLPFADTLNITNPMIGVSTPILAITNLGNANVAEFTIDNVNASSAALRAYINSQYDNGGSAAVSAEAAGPGGRAGEFRATDASGHASGLTASAAGTGNGITAASSDGNSVEASTPGNGSSIFGWTTTGSNGRAGRFRSANLTGTQHTVEIESNGTNTALFVNHRGASGNITVLQSNNANVARIDKTGKGFFNGGTQNFGADLAEAFEVTGSTDDYEPGDVLVIATDADRTVERSASAYSTLVAGVYATKPGVLLTEETIDSDLGGTVPMGVVGVIPTKVCDQNGVIRRGDLLVTSGIAGHAMKADPGKVKTGQVIGKALEEFTGKGSGKIRVLVNVK